MSLVKSYELNEKQKSEVSKVLEESKQKYDSFAHIVMESTFDAGVFFEHELEDE